MLYVISLCVHVCVLNRFSCVQGFAAPWNLELKAPLSMGFHRQEYWSGLPCLPTGYLPDAVYKSTCLMSPALAGRYFTTSGTWEAH